MAITSGGKKAPESSIVNKKTGNPLPMALQQALTSEPFDIDRKAELDLNELEGAVVAKRCSLGFALARVFQLGAEYTHAKQRLAAKAQAIAAKRG